MLHSGKQIVLALALYALAFSGTAQAEFTSLGKVAQVTQSQINLACSHRFKFEAKDTTQQVVQVLYYPVTRTDSTRVATGWYYNFSAPIVGFDAIHFGYEAKRRITLKQAAYGRKVPSHLTASIAPAGETSSYTLDVNSIGAHAGFTAVADIADSALQELALEQNCSGS